MPLCTAGTNNVQKGAGIDRRRRFAVTARTETRNEASGSEAGDRLAPSFDGGARDERSGNLTTAGREIRICRNNRRASGRESGDLPVDPRLTSGKSRNGEWVGKKRKRGGCRGVRKPPLHALDDW